MANAKGSSAGKRGRDAGNGQFVDQATVKRRPKSTVNETVKKGAKKK